MAQPQFSALLSAIGEERLRAHMAAGERLHLKAPAGVDPAALLTLADIEEAFALGRIPAEMIKVFAGYRKLDLAAFGVIDDGGRVVNTALARLARQRTTLVISAELDRAVPRLWPFACAAERAFGDAVGISAIASFGDETGLSPHYDSESLVIVQLEGAKTWRFYGDAVAGSARKFTKPDWDDRPCTGELLMEPGDVLFVPPGLQHSCIQHG